MMSGVKTDIGVLGVNSNVDRGDCSTLPGNEVANASEIFTELGKEVGIVSTARITHATPGAAYAHSVDRNFAAALPEGCDTQKTIADQLLDAMYEGRVDVAMGGGRRNFITGDMTDNEGDSGRREDGRNLIEEAQENGIAYAWNAETAGELPTDGSTPILGIFEDSHMSYEADRGDEPSLSEMTEIALTNLQAKTNDEDTLLIVTADHEHSFALNGYCGRGSDILGLCMGINNQGVENTGEPVMAADGKPYTVGMYTNGSSSVLLEQPGGEFFGSRPVVTNEEAQDIDYVQQALVPRSSESHSAEDVAVYAKGPFAHLFEGTVEQNYIFHVMHHAFTAE
jgi:alkaline phosphatase